MEQNTQQPNQPATAGQQIGQAAEAAPQQENLLDDVYDDSMEGYDKPVKKARNILLLIGAFQLIAIATVTDLPELEMWITVGIYVFFAALFVGLGLWTKKRPYYAILTGLIIYGSLLVFSAVLEPESIVKGIILKVVAITLLISGLKNAKEVQTWMDNKRARQ